MKDITKKEGRCKRILGIGKTEGEGKVPFFGLRRPGEKCRSSCFLLASFCKGCCCDICRFFFLVFLVFLLLLYFGRDEN